MPWAHVANGNLLGLDGVASRVGCGAGLDGVLVVDAPAGREALHELDAHGESAGGVEVDDVYGVRRDVYACKVCRGVRA